MTPPTGLVKGGAREVSVASIEELGISTAKKNLAIAGEVWEETVIHFSVEGACLRSRWRNVSLWFNLAGECSASETF
ncbi:MAG TPA: hypothetical protein V6D11_18565 [Waterburya sp.]